MDTSRFGKHAAKPQSGLVNCQGIVYHWVYHGLSPYANLAYGFLGAQVLPF